MVSLHNGTLVILHHLFVSLLGALPGWSLADNFEHTEAFCAQER
jgi:hypothetical protein